MSSRTSSRSIFTTVPSTMSPSLKSRSEASMASTELLRGQVPHLRVRRLDRICDQLLPRTRRAPNRALGICRGAGAPRGSGMVGDAAETRQCDAGRRQCPAGVGLGPVRRPSRCRPAAARRARTRPPSRARRGRPPPPPAPSATSNTSSSCTVRSMWHSSSEPSRSAASTRIIAELEHVGSRSLDRRVQRHAAGPGRGPAGSRPAARDVAAASEQRLGEPSVAAARATCRSR